MTLKPIKHRTTLNLRLIIQINLVFTCSYIQQNTVRHLTVILLLTFFCQTWRVCVCCTSNEQCKFLSNKDISPLDEQFLFLQIKCVYFLVSLSVYYRKLTISGMWTRYFWTSSKLIKFFSSIFQQIIHESQENNQHFIHFQPHCRLTNTICLLQIKGKWIILLMYCSYLLGGLFVLADQQCPRLQQDVQCVILNLVKQLLKSRHHLVIHLPPGLLINTQAPPGRAEEIGGVKELRGEERRGEERS